MIRCFYHKAEFSFLSSLCFSGFLVLSTVSELASMY